MALSDVKGDSMDDIQAILGLIAAFLGVIFLVLQIIERLIKLIYGGGVPPDWVKALIQKASVALILLVVAVILTVVATFVWPPQRHAVVAIKTAHNRYVSAMGGDWDWLVRAETDRVDDFEEFTLICLEKGMVALQIWHKTAEGKHRYVTAMDDQWHEDEDWHWVLRGQTDVIDNFEKFTMLDAETGNRQTCTEVVKSLEDSGNARVAFQTWHTKEDRHRFVTAMDDTWTENAVLHWVLRAETNFLGASEKFTLELLRWEWEINREAYGITIGGSLLVLLAFLVIYRRRSKTSAQPAEAGSESGDENARDEDEPQVESNSGG